MGAEQFQKHILTIITFLPLAGAALVAFIPRRATTAIKTVALLVSAATFAISVPLFFWFRTGTPGMQFTVDVPWITLLGQQAIRYSVGIDGISLFMVLLTTFLTMIAIAGSFAGIKDREREYYALMLMLETGMLGVFVALDLVLFYVFWEAMLIPMYFIIGVWGGPRRIYAAVKFFIYTMAGSLLMLVAIIAMAVIKYQATGVLTFSVQELYGLEMARGTQTLLFLAYALAFAIKVPMFPFHTWLPDAHVEAPTAGSVILAGVLLKMGTYGFLRFCIPFFPEASLAFAPVMIALGIIGIIYGALVALVQPDMKKLVAYSSVSHLGVSVLGIFVFTLQGAQGSLVQMISHGFSTGALFLLVGMIYERRHTRLIEDYGGIWASMPKYGAIFVIVTMASIGLPFLSGFVGEWLVLVGSWLANPWYAVLAATGAILSACYMLWMLQRVLQGPITRDENRSLKDLNFREMAVLVPLVAGTIWLGVYPKPFLDRMEPSVDNVIRMAQSAGVSSPASYQADAAARKEAR
ncbi:MAG: NADH:ubiquinone oxidoreductase subunit M [Armatimonadota bacterium]|nr:MAG: NADH:ubiquinone oxidoreductase subunit M [Armatimonadota bacterium]